MHAVYISLRQELPTLDSATGHVSSFCTWSWADIGSSAFHPWPAKASLPLVLVSLSPQLLSFQVTILFIAFNKHHHGLYFKFMQLWSLAKKSKDGHREQELSCIVSVGLHANFWVRMWSEVWGKVSRGSAVLQVSPDVHPGCV